MNDCAFPLSVMWQGGFCSLHTPSNNMPLLVALFIWLKGVITSNGRDKTVLRVSAFRCLSFFCSQALALH